MCVGVKVQVGDSSQCGWVGYFVIVKSVLGTAKCVWGGDLLMSACVIGGLGSTVFILIQAPSAYH